MEIQRINYPYFKSMHRTYKRILSYLKVLALFSTGLFFSVFFTICVRRFTKRVYYQNKTILYGRIIVLLVTKLGQQSDTCIITNVTLLNIITEKKYY